ncbi:MAG: PIN domain-containing protein [Trueperaceae bacterium]
MSVREFVDSNILVYFHDTSAEMKRPLATTLIERLWASGGGCASVQVLQEFYVVSTGKLGLPSDSAEAQVRRLSSWRLHSPTPEDIVTAIRIHRNRQLSFWDAMIVRSAVRLGCQILWTEDLNSGQVIEGVEIRNPFTDGTDRG